MLASDATGDPGSPAVVLVHGWPLDRSIWRTVAEAIAAAGYRVLAPDLPGFGASGPLSGPPTVEAYADGVARFLETADVRRAAIAGHSFGGYVALALGERHPGSVRGLGLIASRTLADSPAARAGREETIRKVRTEGTQALLPGLAEQLVARDAPSSLRDEAARLIARASPEAVVAGLAAMAARPDRAAVFARYAGPVLVVHGEADQLVPVAQAAQPSGRAGPAVRRILPRVGHMPMWEAPEETSGAIIAWARAVHGAKA